MHLSLPAPYTNLPTAAVSRIIGTGGTDNLKKHGVSFDEASTVFGDPLAATVSDPEHSTEEVRLVTMGQTAKHQLVVVVHAARGEDIRIISAR
jgi:uncharacterized DUF497 family protein